MEEPKKREKWCEDLWGNIKFHPSKKEDTSEPTRVHQFYDDKNYNPEDTDVYRKEMDIEPSYF